MAGGEAILRELVYLLGSGDNRLMCTLVCSLSHHGERANKQLGHSCGMRPAAQLFGFPWLLSAFSWYHLMVSGTMIASLCPYNAGTVYVLNLGLLRSLICNHHFL